MNNLQVLVSNLESALSQKESIVNNQQSYYYNEIIRTKHARRVGPFKSTPYYTEHTERRFNQGQYDQAIANANAVIDNVGNLIQPAINQFHDNSLQANNQLLGECSARYQAAVERNNQLKGSVEQKKNELQQLMNQNDEVQKYHKSNICLREEIKSQTEAIFDIFNSADSSLRSFYLSELWLNYKNNNNVIAVIKSLGFDANMLAYYAITENNEELFDLAIENKADFSNFLIEDMTLLQKIIKSSNEEFLKKVLSLKDLDISASILNAVDNDMNTINELLKHKPELLIDTKFYGCTLLQIAVMANNQEFVEKILAIDSSVINIPSNDGESTFKIAIRTGNDDIIKTLKNNVDLNTEVEQFNTLISNDIKAKILSDNDIDAIVKLHEGDTNILIQYKTDLEEESRLLNVVPKFDEDYLLKMLDSSNFSISSYAPHDTKIITSCDNNQII